MTPFIMPGLLSPGLLGVAMMSDDEDLIPVETEDNDDDNEEVVDPDDPDIGASFDVDGDVISIDVGEDETGSVVAVHTEVHSSMENDDGPVTQTIDYGVSFYLVPEGVDFPPSVEDIAANLPDEAETDEQLGTGLRGWAPPLTGYEVISDTRTDDFQIESNRDVESYTVLEREYSGPLVSGNYDGMVYGVPLIEVDDDEYEDGRIPFEMADGLIYQGFIWEIDSTGAYPLVTDTGSTARTAVDAIGHTPA